MQQNLNEKTDNIEIITTNTIKEISQYFQISTEEVDQIPRVWTDGRLEKVSGQICSITNKNLFKTTVAVFWEVESPFNIAKFAEI